MTTSKTAGRLAPDASDSAGRVARRPIAIATAVDPTPRRTTMEATTKPTSSAIPRTWTRLPDRGPGAVRTLPLDQGRDELFVFMMRAFRPHGGIARASELQLRHPGSTVRVGQGCAPLQFDFGGLTWLPCFQFSPSSLDVRPSVRRIAAELGDVFDGWRLSLWFAEPNAWLDGRAPVDAMQYAIEAVCAAARADRYVATA